MPSFRPPIAPPDPPSAIVSGIVASLLDEIAQGQVVTLDRVAEAIGAAGVTMADIEAIFAGLESAGRRVEAETKDPPAALAQVLATVRAFSAVSGRRPTVPEMARHSGLSIGEVRFALLYARVLVR